MKTVNINGREIKTNMGGNYSVRDGNNTKNGVVMICQSVTEEWNGKKYCRPETEMEMIERLVNQYGFRKVTFCFSATAVKGYHDLYALCYR